MPPLVIAYRVFQRKTALALRHPETTYLLGVEIWQQGVLMSTPCSLRPNRLVVSEYEVPKVWVIFPETLCTILRKLVYDSMRYQRVVSQQNQYF